MLIRTICEIIFTFATFQHRCFCALSHLENLFLKSITNYDVDEVIPQELILLEFKTITLFKIEVII